MSKEKTIFESNAYHYSDPLLKVYRIHPNGVRIEKAERTLKGRANKDALVWCGPYGIANSLGWWIYPGFDIDVTCHSSPVEGSFTGRWGGHFSYSIKSYDQSDMIQMKQFEDKNPNKYGQIYNGRQHYSIDEPEKNCISLWTGCVFQMPKDWCMLIKTPTNIGLMYDYGCPAMVQEGLLELDWMRYDIWTNFKFHTLDKTLSFRKDQDWPIAQLIPIHRSSFDTQWQTEEKYMNPNDEDCVRMYERYSEYNYKKWQLQGEKDPFTFKKLKKSEMLQCPHKNLFEDKD
jgi:hypothetical protein